MLYINKNHPLSTRQPKSTHLNIKTASHTFVSGRKTGSCKKWISCNCSSCGFIFLTCLCNAVNNKYKLRGVYSVPSALRVSLINLHSHSQISSRESVVNRSEAHRSSGCLSLRAFLRVSKLCSAHSVLFAVFSGQIPSLNESSSSNVTSKLNLSVQPFSSSPFFTLSPFFSSTTFSFFLWEHFHFYYVFALVEVTLDYAVFLLVLIQLLHVVARYHLCNMDTNQVALNKTFCDQSLIILAWAK